MTKEIEAIKAEVGNNKATDYVASYAEAKAYAQENEIKSMRAWFNFHNPRKPGGQLRPSYIPSDPSKYYGRRGQWVSWSDFLGTNKKATNVIKNLFCDFDECKKWFADNKIYTVTQFRELSKNGFRPEFIPSAPDKRFNVKFSELLCPKKSPYLDFESAKALVQKYHFKDYKKFREGRREDKEHLACVPCNPDKHYEEWTSWPDFLGYPRIR